MRWGGEWHADGRYYAGLCEHCGGRIGGCRHCDDGYDYFDPLPFLRALGMAAALTLAWELAIRFATTPTVWGVPIRDAWRPNTDGRAVDVEGWR